MINSLLVTIHNELKNNVRLFIYKSVYNVLYEVLSLKYLCDNKILSYDDIMKLDDLSELELDDENLKFKEKVNYKKLLQSIQYENLEEIIKEYINYHNERNNIFSNSKKRKIIYFNSYVFEDFYYDLEGNTTYIYRYIRDKSGFLTFKLFDDILKISNDYKKLEEIELSNYDEFHYFGLRKINEDNNFLNIVNDSVNNNLKVICYTQYNYISNYKKGMLTLSKLKNVIFLPNNKSILIYEKKDNDEISIINYNAENNFDKLNNIINNNRKIKDVLIKVTNTDIRKNNYRLGFRLYQLEYETKNKTINEIVDQNSRLIERLERINEEVEKEINNLINK